MTKIQIVQKWIVVYWRLHIKLSIIFSHSIEIYNVEALSLRTTGSTAYNNNAFVKGRIFGKEEEEEKAVNEFIMIASALDRWCGQSHNIYEVWC